MGPVYFLPERCSGSIPPVKRGRIGRKHFGRDMATKAPMESLEFGSTGLMLTEAAESGAIPAVIGHTSRQDGTFCIPDTGRCPPSTGGRGGSLAHWLKRGRMNKLVYIKERKGGYWNARLYLTIV